MFNQFCTIEYTWGLKRKKWRKHFLSKIKLKLKLSQKTFSESSNLCCYVGRNWRNYSKDVVKIFVHFYVYKDHKKIEVNVSKLGWSSMIPIWAKSVRNGQSCTCPTTRSNLVFLLKCMLAVKVLSFRKSSPLGEDNI